MKKETSLKLDTQYSQFYIQDEYAKEDLGEIWTEEASIRNLAIAPGVIGVGTAGSYVVPVTIKVSDEEPTMLAVDSKNISQINECDLVVTSGKIVVAGTMDYFPEAKRIELTNGTYRVRIYYFNLESTNEDGLSGNDYYEIEIWPSLQEEGIKVIK